MVLSDPAAELATRSLRVVVFGTYDRVAHPRIAVLETALRDAGVTVTEVNVTGWPGGTEAKLRAAKNPLAPGALVRQLVAWGRLTARYRAAGEHDVVLVGYFGHLDVHLARLLAGRGRVVLDMFLSVYEAVALDRAAVPPHGLRARLAGAIDRRAVAASRLALLDTQAHVDFCVRELGIPADRLAVVPVGAEADRFPLRAMPPGQPLRIVFYSTFIPLHGTMVVAEAARQLAGHDVELTVIGQGQERDRFDLAVAGLDGVRALDWVDYDRLGEVVADHHVVLGIFSGNAKAASVVPNKVFQAACAGRAIVTADTPAIRAAFAEDEVVLVPPEDPDALAGALLRLAKDEETVAELGRRARARFESDYSSVPLGQHLAALLRREPARAWVAPPRFLLRLDLVRRLLARLPKDRPILELGSGAGAMLSELARLGFQDVTGTDFSASATRTASARLAALPPGRRPRLLRASLDAFAPGRASFAGILAFEVIEHVEDDRRLLAQAYELLEPGGWLLLSVPAHQARFSVVDEAVGHFRRYERDQLRARCTEAGFEVDTLWCYGYPLANLLERVRRRTTAPPAPGSPEALRLRSAESGNTLPARGLVKLLVRPATMAPFLAAQRWFLRTDRGDGYLLLARKPRR
jgi:glycosyltransferase involved in cell wall biosynthesis